MDFIEEEETAVIDEVFQETCLKNHRKKLILQQQSLEDLLSAIQSSYPACSHCKLLKNPGRDNLIDMFFLYNIPVTISGRNKITS